jgi:DNA-binding YbaB/EbfC family protein
MMDFSMLKQAQELKSRLDKAQKELGDITVDADVGRGAIKVTIDGKQKLHSIAISPKIINPERPEELEKMVLQAVNEAIAKSQKLAAKQLKGLTSGLKIPGLM